MKTSFCVLFSFFFCLVAVAARLGGEATQNNRRLPHFRTWDSTIYYSCGTEFELVGVEGSTISAKWDDSAECRGTGEVAITPIGEKALRGTLTDATLYENNDETEDGVTRVIGGKVGDKEVVFVQRELGNQRRKLEENHRRLEDALIIINVFVDAYLEVDSKNGLSVMIRKGDKGVAATEPFYKFELEYEE